MFNTWNPQFSHALYPQMMAGYLTQRSGGRCNLNSKPVADAIRRIASEKPGFPPDSPQLFQEAWDSVRTEALAPALRSGSARELMPTKPVFGCVMEYVSEVGPPEHLAGLLKHADEIFNPRWHKGGFYYERCDEVVDEDGEWKFCDTFTGNALVAYGRLNVPDGMRKMYETPWTHEVLDTTPWIDGLGGFEQGVDFLRGVWDQDAKAMIMTVKSWSGERTIGPVVKGLSEGEYEVYLDGEFVGVEAVKEGEVVAVEFTVGVEERDLVVMMKQE
jgi:hypothetical protein